MKAYFKHFIAKMKEIPSVIILLWVFIYFIPTTKNNVIGIASIVIMLFLIEAVFLKRNEETPKRMGSGKINSKV